MAIIKGVDKAAERYLQLQGYEKLGSANNFLVLDDEDGTIVFVNVLASKGEFIESKRFELKQDFERALFKWYEDHPADQDCKLRCDEICISVLSDSRALVRHYVNVFN